MRYINLSFTYLLASIREVCCLVIWGLVSHT